MALKIRTGGSKCPGIIIKKNIYHLVPSDEYLEDLRQNLLEYAQQFPDFTYTDLVEQFGKPEDLAAEFVNDQKPYSPRERAIHRNKLRVFFYYSCHYCHTNFIDCCFIETKTSYVL